MRPLPSELTPRRPSRRCASSRVTPLSGRPAVLVRTCPFAHAKALWELEGMWPSLPWAPQGWWNRGSTMSLGSERMWAAFSTARRARVRRRSSTGSSLPPASINCRARAMARSVGSSEVAFHPDLDVVEVPGPWYSFPGGAPTGPLIARRNPCPARARSLFTFPGGAPVRRPGGRVRGCLPGQGPAPASPPVGRSPWPLEPAAVITPRRDIRPPASARSGLGSRRVGRVGTCPRDGRARSPSGAPWNRRRARRIDGHAARMAAGPVDLGPSRPRRRRPPLGRAHGRPPGRGRDGTRRGRGDGGGRPRCTPTTSTPGPKRRPPSSTATTTSSPSTPSTSGCRRRSNL